MTDLPGDGVKLTKAERVILRDYAIQGPGDAAKTKSGRATAAFCDMLSANYVERLNSLGGAIYAITPSGRALLNAEKKDAEHG